jgi:hypothetical protein
MKAQGCNEAAGQVPAASCVCAAYQERKRGRMFNRDAGQGVLQGIDPQMAGYPDLDDQALDVQLPPY